MVNAVRSPALRACTFSTFVISGADMGVFPLMGVLVVGRRELSGKGTLVSCSIPVQSLLRCTAQLLLRGMWSYA